MGRIFSFCRIAGRSGYKYSTLLVLQIALRGEGICGKDIMPQGTPAFQAWRTASLPKACQGVCDCEGYNCEGKEDREEFIHV
jgi:hypothetical protein